MKLQTAKQDHSVSLYFLLLLFSRFIQEKTVDSNSTYAKQCCQVQFKQLPYKLPLWKEGSFKRRCQWIDVSIVGSSWTWYDQRDEDRVCDHGECELLHDVVERRNEEIHCDSRLYEYFRKKSNKNA